MGLAIGIGVGSAQYAEKIQKKCLRQGLLLQNQDKSIVMFPALNMDEDTAREGLKIFENCL